MLLLLRTNFWLGMLPGCLRASSASPLPRFFPLSLREPPLPMGDFTPMVDLHSLHMESLPAFSYSSKAPPRYCILVICPFSSLTSSRVFTSLPCISCFSWSCWV